MKLLEAFWVAGNPAFHEYLTRVGWVRLGCIFSLLSPIFLGTTRAKSSAPQLRVFYFSRSSQQIFLNCARSLVVLMTKVSAFLT